MEFVNIEDVQDTKPVGQRKKPVKGWRIGGICLDVWSNYISTQAGDIEVFRFSLRKRYKDKQTGEWKDTNSYRINDLPKVALLCTRAYGALL